MTDVGKKLHRRWGRKFKDNRDWHVYNEQLVRRGEIFIDLDFVGKWDEELAEIKKFPKEISTVL